MTPADGQIYSLAGAPLYLGPPKLPLETATYLSDLVTSNPAHTDGLSQADSHARLIKSTLKATFPNFTGVALASTQAQLDAAVSVAAGTTPSRIPMGTAALPGLTVVGDINSGWWSPAADQLALSLAGTQVLLLGGTALVTTLGVAAAAFTTTGAYSGGTGQLVPIGAVLEWYDDVLPAEGGYCWANGQIIASANTVCPVLLGRWSNKFGGNGTTTMGVPDRRDTVGVGKSTMGGVASRSLQTLTNTVLGTLLGLANNVLTTLNLPPYIPSGSVASTSTPTTIVQGALVSTSAGSGSAIQAISNGTGATGSVASTGALAGNAQGGTSSPVNNVQPSTTCNYILRLA
jgi:microcystin-dependent protein